MPLPMPSRCLPTSRFRRSPPGCAERNTDPVVGVGGQLRLRGEFIMSEDCPKRARPPSPPPAAARRSRCAGEDVAPGRSGLGGVGLLAGIEPGVDPDDLDLGVGLVVASPRSNASMRKRLRESGTRRCSRSCSTWSSCRRSDHQYALIELGGVVETFGARCSRSHARTSLRELLGDLDRRVHEANEVVKTILQPLRASCSIARSASLSARSRRRCGVDLVASALAAKRRPGRAGRNSRSLDRPGVDQQALTLSAAWAPAASRSPARPPPLHQHCTHVFVSSA